MLVFVLTYRLLRPEYFWCLKPVHTSDHEAFPHILKWEVTSSTSTVSNLRDEKVFQTFGKLMKVSRFGTGKNKKQEGERVQYILSKQKQMRVKVVGIVRWKSWTVYIKKSTLVRTTNILTWFISRPLWLAPWSGQKETMLLLHHPFPD